VYPLLGYLLLRQVGRRFGFAAAGAGLALGLVVTIGLVRYDEHAVAEAAAGWLLGAGVSIGALYQAEPRGVPLGLQSAVCAVLVYVASASLMQSAHVGYWMVKLALALSGNARPYSWACG
ncbi:MAG: hypothetical protein ACREWI_06935, partial [Telluria sp.]